MRVAVACLLEWLETTDIACQEGEDGHANTALEEKSNDGPLEEAGSCALGIGRCEKIVIERTTQVGHDDGEGGQTAEALRKVSMGVLGGGASLLCSCGEELTSIHFTLRAEGALSLLRGFSNCSMELCGRAVNDRESVQA